MLSEDSLQEAYKGLLIENITTTPQGVLHPQCSETSLSVRDLSP